MTTLSLVRDDLADALASAEELVAAGRHEEAVEQLDQLWPEVRGNVSFALRHHLALSWSEMYRGELDRAAEVLGHAQTIVRSPRFDAGDRAELLYRRGCVAFKQGDIPFGDVPVGALRDFPLDVVMLLDLTNAGFREYVSEPGKWVD